MKFFLIICSTLCLTHARIFTQPPSCPAREKTNCKNCHYYYPKRLKDLFIRSPLFDTQSLCARCFSLRTASQRNDCYRCMTTTDKVLRNRNELWCPLYADNLGQSADVLNLLSARMRPIPVPLSKAKKTDKCPKDYRRLCIDCKYHYPLIAQTNGIKKPRKDSADLCATCFALPIREQQRACYDCIMDPEVMKAGNEPWCYAYAYNFDGAPEFLSVLQTARRVPIPDDY